MRFGKRIKNKASTGLRLFADRGGNGSGSVATEERDLFREELSGVVGEGLAGRAHDLILEGRWEELLGLRRQMQAAVWARGLVKWPLSSVREIGRLFQTEAFIRWRLPRLFVALLGEDRRLLQEVAQLAGVPLFQLFTNEDLRIRRVNPALLTEEWPELKPPGGLGDSVRLGLDFVWGYLRNTRLRKKQNSLVLFANYFHDLLGGDGGEAHLAAMAPLVPSPDLAILIGGNPSEDRFRSLDEQGRLRCLRDDRSAPDLAGEVVDLVVAELERTRCEWPRWIAN